MGEHDGIDEDRSAPAHAVNESLLSWLSANFPSEVDPMVRAERHARPQTADATVWLLATGACCAFASVGLGFR